MLTDLERDDVLLDIEKAELSIIQIFGLETDASGPRFPYSERPSHEVILNAECPVEGRAMLCVQFALDII